MNSSALPAHPHAPADALLLYERDDDGVAFAVEQVRAPRWEPRLAAPPAPERADVRVVHLEQGPAPRDLPPWLEVVVVGRRGRGVAEAEAAYVVGYAPLSAPRRLWPWSPHHRQPGARLEEFLRAAATALRHPEAAPGETARQLDAFHAFARAHEPFTLAASLHATALERWFHVLFREPERLADAILLARIEVAAPADAAVLRFLREADIPQPGAAYADLAVDRSVLIEQASAWRYLEGRNLAPALAAARSWQRRYLRAYADHYRRVVAPRAVLLAEAETLEARAAALGRLNTIAALGPTEGIPAILEARAALTALTALPEAADPLAPTTAGIRLGSPDERLRILREAGGAVEAALRARLRRLSAALAGCALDAAEDDLRGVLDAIALSEVDHLDRVLDDRLTARLEALLARAPRSPLALVARQFPAVTRANLEAAVEEFRRAAVQAIEDSADGRAALDA